MGRPNCIEIAAVYRRRSLSIQDKRRLWYSCSYLRDFSSPPFSTHRPHIVFRPVLQADSETEYISIGGYDMYPVGDTRHWNLDSSLPAQTGSLTCTLGREISRIEWNKSYAVGGSTAPGVGS